MRLPAFVREHIGSIPIRITGLPGNFPVRRTRPLIVPVFACAEASLTRIRQTATNTTSRDRIGMMKSLLLSLLLLVLRFVRVPVLQMAVLAGSVDSITGVQQTFDVFLFDGLESFQCRVVESMSE